DLDHMLALLENANPVREQIFQECIDRANLRVIGRLYRGYRILQNTRRSVRSPADMRGLKIRSPEAAVNTQAIRAMGAIPVTLTASELFTSMAQGVCDGAEQSITESYGLRIHELAKYVSETNYIAATVLILVNEDWYQSLTPEQQKAVTRAGEEATEFRLALLKDEEEKAYKAFADRGAEILYAKDIDMDAFVEAAQPVYKLLLDRIDEKLYFAIRDMKY
ncbi:MAG: TRAP transporter substrate-binding protein, partial [Planctomycetes bacterium]|nr:TRAP transporter substrate-binding protein [Planctomycetota bacterium]